MRIVLLEAHTRLPDAEEERRQPLGGIQSCVVYLADQLAANGHAVTVICAGGAGVRPSGVEGVDVASFPAAVLRDADAVILANRGEFAGPLRARMRADAPLVLWQHHLPEVNDLDAGRSVHGLESPARDQLDAVVFVSEWQRRRYETLYPLDGIGRHVVRNACAPPFLDLAASDAALVEAKAAGLGAAYLSSHDRGLDTLLNLWPTVVHHVPDARLSVFYGKGDNVLDLTGNYGRFIGGEPVVPGAVARGGLPHGALAETLARTAVVAYPTWFEETACIALLEAMLAGCRVVCSDRGALPESMAGHARLVPWDDDPAVFSRRFATALVEELRRWRAGDPALGEGVARQRRLFRAYDWQRRALEWESLIAFLRGVRATAGRRSADG